MKQKAFYVYIKSHCEAPDFETEILAKNKKEAAIKLATTIASLSGGENIWHPDDLIKYIQELWPRHSPTKINLKLPKSFRSVRSVSNMQQRVIAATVAVLCVTGANWNILVTRKKLTNRLLTNMIDYRYYLLLWLGACLLIAWIWSKLLWMV